MTGTSNYPLTSMVIKKNPENYFDAQLLTYFPRSNEVNDLLQHSYNESFEKKRGIILEKDNTLTTMQLI